MRPRLFKSLRQVQYFNVLFLVGSLLAALLVAGVANQQLQRNQAEVAAAHEQLVALHELTNAINRAALMLLSIIGEDHDSDLPRLLADVEDFHYAFAKFRVLTERFGTPFDQSSAQESLASIRTVRNDLIESAFLFREGNAAAAEDHYFRFGTWRVDSILSEFETSIAQKQRQLVRLHADADTLQAQITYALLVGFSLFIAVVSFVGIFLARMTIRPIASLVSTMRRIAGGTHVARAAPTGLAEIDELASSFNNMMETLDQRAEIIAVHAAKLEDRAAEMERFTYTVSHDLKSPLVTISSFTDLLSKDVAAQDEEKIESDIGYIRGATTKMYSLLEELLEISRLGQVALAAQTINATEVVDEAVQQATGAIERCGARIVLELNGVQIFADRNRLLEVLQNLIENACKYSSEEPAPIVTIGFEQDDAGCTFFVRDNGIGIAVEYHARIFDLFEQLDRSAPGNGIGLTIVKRIIELHNGRLWLESEGPGRGTTFFFWLPAETEAGSIDAGSTQAQMTVNR